MPLRQKYSITDWVLSRDCVEIGDTVAFFDENAGHEVHAQIIGFTSPDLRQCLEVRRADGDIETLNFYNTIVYLVKPISKSYHEGCTCGAKHTSNPNFHLSYCEEGNK